MYVNYGIIQWEEWGCVGGGGTPNNDTLMTDDPSCHKVLERAKSCLNQRLDTDVNIISKGELKLIKSNSKCNKPKNKDDPKGKDDP